MDRYSRFQRSHRHSGFKHRPQSTHGVVERCGVIVRCTQQRCRPISIDWTDPRTTAIYALNQLRFKPGDVILLLERLVNDPDKEISSTAGSMLAAVKRRTE